MEVAFMSFQRCLDASDKKRIKLWWPPPLHRFDFRHQKQKWKNDQKLLTCPLFVILLRYWGTEDLRILDKIEPQSNSIFFVSILWRPGYKIYIVYEQLLTLSLAMILILYILKTSFYLPIHYWVFNAFVAYKTLFALSCSLQIPLQTVTLLHKPFHFNLIIFLLTITTVCKPRAMFTYNSSHWETNVAVNWIFGIMKW